MNVATWNILIRTDNLLPNWGFLIMLPGPNSRFISGVHQSYPSSIHIMNRTLVKSYGHNALHHDTEHVSS